MTALIWQVSAAGEVSSDPGSAGDIHIARARLGFGVAKYDVLEGFAW